MLFETTYKGKKYEADAHYDEERNMTFLLVYLDGLEGIFNPISGYSYEDITQDPDSLEISTRAILLDYDLLTNAKAHNFKACESLNKQALDEKYIQN